MKSFPKTFTADALRKGRQQNMDRNLEHYRQMIVTHVMSHDHALFWKFPCPKDAMEVDNSTLLLSSQWKEIESKIIQDLHKAGFEAGMFIFNEIDNAIRD